MFEQQSPSEVQKAPVGPQQLQTPGGGCDSRHCELVPSGLRHDTGLQAAPWAQGSHGAGHCAGSQIRLLGQGWLVEHVVFVQASVGEAGSRQNPQLHDPVAELQLAFGTVLQPVGHAPLVLKHAAPWHSQQTGGATQVHCPERSSHFDPGGAVAGHDPVHAFEAGSRWQPRVVVVVLVLVVVVVVVVVVCPTTILLAGAHSIFGGPSAMGPSRPNWSCRITWVPLLKVARVAQFGVVQVFALIL
jgi:hypothetical protein